MSLPSLTTPSGPVHFLLFIPSEDSLKVSLPPLSVVSAASETSLPRVLSAHSRGGCRSVSILYKRPCTTAQLSLFPKARSFARIAENHVEGDLEHQIQECGVRFRPPDPRSSLRSGFCPIDWFTSLLSISKFSGSTAGPKPLRSHNLGLKPCDPSSQLRTQLFREHPFRWGDTEPRTRPSRREETKFWAHSLVRGSG